MHFVQVTENFNVNILLYLIVTMSPWDQKKVNIFSLHHLSICSVTDGFKTCTFLKIIFLFPFKVGFNFMIAICLHSLIHPFFLKSFSVRTGCILFHTNCMILSLLCHMMQSGNRGSRESQFYQCITMTPVKRYFEYHSIYGSPSTKSKVSQNKVGIASISVWIISMVSC